MTARDIVVKAIPVVVSIEDRMKFKNKRHNMNIANAAIAAIAAVILKWLTATPHFVRDVDAVSTRAIQAKKAAFSNTTETVVGALAASDYVQHLSTKYGNNTNIPINADGVVSSSERDNEKRQKIYDSASWAF